MNVGAVYGHLELLRALVLEYRVDVRLLDCNGHTALLCALELETKQQPHVDVALFLINEAPGVDIHARTSEGLTALMLAARAGVVEVLRALVAKGVDVDAQDKKSRSAVDHAFACKQEEAAIYLLGEGNATVVGYHFMMPVAAQQGRTRLLRALLRRMRADGGPNSEYFMEDMGTAAMMAVGKRQAATLQAVIEEGLDPNFPIHENRLLNEACRLGHRSIVDFLVERGADGMAPGAKGLLPHHLAAHGGLLELLQWLMRTFRIPVDTKGAECGATVLHMAATSGCREAVKWLIGEGADPRLTFHLGEHIKARASNMAVVAGDQPLVRYLLKQEERADAAEAAARRAQNEKRHQKQKKAKARRRAAAEEQGDADGEGGAEQEQDDGAILSAGDDGQAGQQ